MNRSLMFRRILSVYQIRYKTSSISSSSSTQFYSTMKKLIDSKQYRKALDLFDQQSQLSTDDTINMALKACTNLNEYQRGMDIQRQLSPHSLNNRYIQTSLIQFYVQCHDIDNAYRLFSTITNKSNYMYTIMFKGLISNKMPEKVLDLLDKMVIKPDEVTFTVLFNACAQLADDRAKKIGTKLLEQMPNHFRNDIILLNSAVDMLMKFGDVTSAENLFQMIKKKSIVSYGAMINGYVENNMCDKALDLFEQMPLNLNDVIYAIIFNACAQLSHDRAKKIGTKLFNQMPNHFRNDTILLTSAVDMLMKFGDVTSAESFFGKMKKNIVTYAAMMKGYVENNMCDKALDLFEEIPLNLNDVIYIIVFNTCAQLSNDRAKEIGRKLLNKMPTHFEKNNNVQNSAIDMLMKFGDVTSAEHLFQMIEKKDIVTYGAMIKGYVENNMCDKALDLFEQMPLNLNDVIYVIVFNACAQLSHDRAKKIGTKLLDQMPNDFQNNNILLTSAVDMLMKFGDVTSAERFFQMIKKKDIVTYGAMMNGYNINNEPFKCLKLLEEMKQRDIIPDVIVSTIVIGAGARIGMLSRCQSIVDQIPLHLFDDQYISSSLIHMWGKAGSIKNAQQIFQSIHKPDVITYNAMINTFGLNRMGLEAVDLYRKMPNRLRDEVSYICVLNACSHSALLDEAHSIFNEIPHKTEKVITTMIDCLSRLFLFDEAQKLIDDYEKSNPPSSVMYMALLSGARNSRHHILSEKIYKRMKSLFPDQKSALISGSILLYNIYSSLGDEEEAQRVRLNRIKEFGKKVKVGVSWTEVDGELVEFKAHDRSHPRSKEIYDELKRLSTELVQYGHKYDSSWITRPIRENESIESVLCGHSEKLAIAFNFIQRRKPTFIQITKNLRICGDCHQATKLVAKIRQCEIIVRDANCIHHFSPNGTCSCQDHF